MFLAYSVPHPGHADLCEYCPHPVSGRCLMTRAPTAAASAASWPLWPSSTSARCSNHPAMVLKPPSQGTLITLPTVLQPLYPDTPASQPILQPPCPGTPTTIASARPASPTRPWNASVLESRISKAPCSVCSCSSAPCSRRNRQRYLEPNLLT